MFNFERFANAPWEDIYRFLMAGEPPLITKVLVINTLFLVLFVYRKARAKHRMRVSTAYAVQFLLIAINFAVMFQNQSLSLLWKMKGVL